MRGRPVTARNMVVAAKEPCVSIRLCVGSDPAKPISAARLAKPVRLLVTIAGDAEKSTHADAELSVVAATSVLVSETPA